MMKASRKGLGIGVGDVFTIAAVAGIGYVVYKFWKGDWKLPDIGKAVSDAISGAGKTYQEIREVSILPPQKVPVQIVVQPSATEAVKERVATAQGLAETAETLRTILEPVMPWIRLAPVPEITVIEAAPYVIPPELIQKYVGEPGYGLAGISTAVGSQFQKTTGRYLPQ